MNSHSLQIANEAMTSNNQQNEKAGQVVRNGSFEVVAGAKKAVVRVNAGANLAGVLRDGTTGMVIVPRLQAVGVRVTASSSVAAHPAVAAPAIPAPRVRPRPELAFYRKYTEAMLRRYLRMSTEAGRVPSMLGRELFRSKVTSYRVISFEDVVVFCIDVERCLQRLHPEQQKLIARITLQEYTQAEAATLLGLTLRDTVRKYGAALDRLTAIFLEARLLERLPVTRAN